jgi:hypothetical protein
MSYCIEKKYPKAIYLHGYDLMKNGFHDEGIALLAELIEMEIAPSLKISVLHSLAIDAEWRMKDFAKALYYAEMLLQMESLNASFRSKTEQRQERLLKKALPY